MRNMEELLAFLVVEPERKRCEIRYLGQDENYEGQLSLQPNWEVRVWSQRPDGSKYKDPGVGVGITVGWAAFRALTDYFAKPKL